MVRITQSTGHEVPETPINPDTRRGRLERLAELAEYASREYCAHLTARRSEATGQTKLKTACPCADDGSP
jgi:hypothetical protein